MVLRSTLDFAVRRSWLLFPSVAIGAGAGYALAGLSPVMAGGAALGLAPAVAAGLALDYRGHKLRTPTDVRRRFDLETLGAIGRFRSSEDSALPADEFPDALQAYKELAASLRTRGGHELRTLLVTSAGPEEGKSTTAANLATILATQGHKVVLVDGDMRWSALRSTNTRASSLGLSGLLLNYVHTPQLAVVRTNEPNLYLLPAGILPPHPEALLAQPRLGDIVASLRTMADYVIFDSPPVLEAADAGLIARNVDATVMVVNAGRSRSRDVDKALRVLAQADARPLGAVLNAIRTPKSAIELPAPQGHTAPESPAPTPVADASDPYTIDVFRKGTPKPVTAATPWPVTPPPAASLMSLTAASISPAEGTPGPSESPGESPEFARRLAALRNLRLVHPDERPASPVTDEWQPIFPASHEPLLEAETQADAEPIEALIHEEAVAPAVEVFEGGAFEATAVAGDDPLAEIAVLNDLFGPAPTSDTEENDAAEPVEPVSPAAFTPPSPPAVDPVAAAANAQSVDDVLAHMEDTLRLIREMRREKSASNT